MTLFVLLARGNPSGKLHPIVAQHKRYRSTCPLGTSLTNKSALLSQNQALVSTSEGKTYFPTLASSANLK
jgi:hypothetical protein